MSTNFMDILNSLSHDNDADLEKQLLRISTNSKDWGDDPEHKERKAFLQTEKEGYDGLSPEEQGKWQAAATASHDRFTKLTQEQQKLFEKVLLPELFAKLSPKPAPKPEEDSKRGPRSWLIQILTTVAVSLLALRRLQKGGVGNARSGQLAFGLFALSNVVWTWLMRSKPPAPANGDAPVPPPPAPPRDTAADAERKQEIEELVAEKIAEAENARQAKKKENAFAKAKAKDERRLEKAETLKQTVADAVAEALRNHSALLLSGGPSNSSLSSKNDSFPDSDHEEDKEKEEKTASPSLS